MADERSCNFCRGCREWRAVRAAADVLEHAEHMRDAYWWRVDNALAELAENCPKYEDKRDESGWYEGRH